ncbi:MAG: DUF459 domain-containing protein [Verrucomicrobia bacterium]|nr:DUF459 domain-containing protein [Verrucomicrobiota bacterium]MBU1734740.1 DUF459 domain-containing protein [Verrucomicrobiota bacterium]MBU1857758.1 DUF459 domain-containing protein [Verrucomicrobiota bacterium]
MKRSSLNAAFFLVLIACTATGTAQSSGVTAQGKTAFLILGDSVMKTVSVSLERDLAQSTEFRPVSYASIGSGLCRLDLLDWHVKIKVLAETEKPTAAVILIGSNDNQPMQTEKGILQPGSDEWQAEYAHRVGKCMDIMIAGGIKNIIWVALPDMREPDRQEHVLIINKIFSKEAASRPAVVILDTQKIFSREPGKFTSYIVEPDGNLLYVRIQDGVHFNREGANILAAIILKTLNAALKNG